MRSGDVFTDANLQERLMPMERLRPTMWAHARPGVVRTDGSGNISSIVTGTRINLSQGTASARPSIGSILGRSTMKFATPGTQNVLNSDSDMLSLSAFSMASLWWQRSTEVTSLLIQDIFNSPFGRIRSTTTPEAIGEYVSVSGSVSIANNSPVLATLVASGSSGTFRVGSSSISLSDFITPEDSRIQLTSTTGCDYFEVVVFDRQITENETRLLEGVMAWSNGFPEILGAGHPFLTRPPLLGD